MAASASNSVSTAQPAVAAGAGLEQYTAQQVIEMFRALNLPVTDDAAAIEREAQKQNARRLREQNSANPETRAKAAEWFKHLTFLKTRRPELLGIVQRFFDQLADAALAGVLSTGVHTLTSEVYDNLCTMARQQCRLDEPLVRRFVDAYLNRNNLKIGAPLVEPRLVEALTATPDPGSVRLRWQLPADNCDTIVVRRQEGRLQDHRGSTEVCRGNSTEYMDTLITPGQWYTYRVFSISRGVESKNSQAVEAMAIGEIAQAEARWNGQATELRWVNPGGHRAVIIFRCESARPAIRKGASGPEPANAATRLLYHGSGTTWKDTQIAEGRTYHYLLLAEFGNRVYSRGVETAATVPTLPSPVTAVHVAYRDGAVDVWWAPARQAAHEEYAVVRREGTTPPAAHTQGQTVVVTAQTRFQDTQVEPGRRYVYAIFTKRHELYSRIGIPTEPIVTLAEVGNLTVEAGDGTVVLRWQTPPQVATVVVQRSLHPPKARTDGVGVPTLGAGYAQDTGLRNDRTYHYLVRCLYRLPDGQEMSSSGMRCSATPSGLPDTVQEFQVQADNGRVECTWASISRGQVTVVRCKARPTFAPGDLLNASQIVELGHRLPLSSPTRVEDTAPLPQEPYYAAFTVAGSRAIAGPVQLCVATEDVSHLQATLINGGVKLSWDWPRNCQAVVIAQRQDRWPEGPQDPQATLVHWSLDQYLQQHESFHDMLPPDSGSYYYVIYAQPAGAPELVYAPGTSPGCRCEVRPTRLYQLTYSVRLVKKWFRPARLEMTWEVDGQPRAFAGFAILGSGRGVPKGIGDGIEILRWTRQEEQEALGSRQYLSKSLRDIQLPRATGQLYYKLFLLDTADQATLLVRHPDVSRALVLPRRVRR